MKIMARVLVTLVKTAAIVGFAWATYRWLSFFVPWAAPKSYIGPYRAAFYAGCILIALASASAAVILLNGKNIWRVGTNVLIIFAGFALGWIFGDPLSRGSYDHLGGVETAQGWLIFATLGTLAGYALTLLRRERK
jgi:hypothetical protein